MQKELVSSTSLRLAELKDLAQVQGPCLTIYLPLESSPNTAHIASVRLKSAIRQADEKLQQWNVDKNRQRKMIGALQQIEAESSQWGGSGGSLVIFQSPTMLRAFEVAQQLDEQLVVAEHFQVLPLLRTLQIAEQRFYILALSRKHVRLLRCTSKDCEEVAFPEGTPTAMDEWLNTRLPNEAPDHGAVQDSGSFTSTHDRDKLDEHLANYFRVINKAVTETLRTEKDPLVLVGVDYELSMYKGINTYPDMASEGVQGSAESLKGGEMHRRALEVVQPVFEEPARKGVGLWEKIAGTDRATTRFPEIVKAAFEGRIAHLFVADGARSMGSFDRETMEMRGIGRQENLVNAAAVQAIANGGDVFIMKPDQVPGGVEMAAILRF